LQKLYTEYQCYCVYSGYKYVPKNVFFSRLRNKGFNVTKKRLGMVVDAEKISSE